MKYVIMCGGEYRDFEMPKQLAEVNGEKLIERTIRLLKENGAKDIFISSNNKVFDGYGVERLEHDNSYSYCSGKMSGYWLDAFYPKFAKNVKVTYIFGDVYFSSEAIKTIVKFKSTENVLLGSRWEPFAYVVNNYKEFLSGIAAVKKLQDEGKTERVALVWELYRYLNGFDVNEHVLGQNFVLIDDETDDIDSPTKLRELKEKVEIPENVFYFNHINSIGGIETFFYNLARKYKDRDITVVYRTGDINQILRLREYVRVIKFNPDKKIKCKKMFFNYPIDIIDNVEADEIIQLIHSNYRVVNLPPQTHPRINRYIAVSKAAADNFKEQTGIEAEVCYNPLCVDKPKKALQLISTTRLTKEKGKKRIEKLASLLDAAGIKYHWCIYTNDEKVINNKNIEYRKPQLDVLPYVAAADYLVQLSDDEAFCYSVVEALSVGTPVIVTDCPVFKELGLNKENSFVLDMELNKVPIEKIVKGLPEFKYTPPKDNWGDILSGKSKYTPPERQTVLVQAIVNYFDIKLNEDIKRHAQFRVTKERAADLKAKGLCKIIGE